MSNVVPTCLLLLKLCSINRLRQQSLSRSANTRSLRPAKLTYNLWMWVVNGRRRSQEWLTKKCDLGKRGGWSGNSFIHRMNGTEIHSATYCRRGILVSFVMYWEFCERSPTALGANRSATLQARRSFQRENAVVWLKCSSYVRDYWYVVTICILMLSE